MGLAASVQDGDRSVQHGVLMMKRDEWNVSSTCAGASCVEVMPADDFVYVGNNDGSPIAMRFTTGEWNEFVGAVKRGEFDV